MLPSEGDVFPKIFIIMLTWIVLPHVSVPNIGRGVSNIIFSIVVI